MLRQAARIVTKRSISVSPLFLITAAFISQLLIGIMLWSHRSDSGVILGAFSIRYATALGVHAITVLAWLAALIYREKLIRLLTRLNSRARYAAIGLVSIGVFVCWIFPIEDGVQQFAALNGFFISLLLIVTLPTDTPGLKRVFIVLAGVGVLMLIPSFTTALTSMPFSPDEAHWADYATTPFAAENAGLYARTWLFEPQPIVPGLGWSIAAYGWLLENVAFNIRIGRLWNFVVYLIAFSGTAALTYRLYDKRAAALSALFSILSLAFVTTFDYRPDHQIAAAAPWMMLCAVVASQSNKSAYRSAASLLCGLLAALSMQLHAIAIAFIAAFGLYFSITSITQLLVTRRLSAVLPLASFALGVLMGGAIFYAFNIAPVGGISAYLNGLSSRTNRQYTFPRFLTWLSLLEAVIIVIAFIFVARRRRASDRLFLSLILCLLIALALLDTQGYRSPVAALYAVPVGALFASGFAPEASQRSWLAGAILIITVLGSASSALRWNSLKAVWDETERQPYLYEELREPLLQFVHEDDIIVSSHLLIWTLGNDPNFYSTAGELYGMERWGIPAEEVWERVHPTLIVDIPTQMTINEGLLSYMNTHQFQQCQSFRVQHAQVNLYRQEC